ncbi:octopamine receptor 2-like [Mizuhopecten yessoensis]|uniref:octopamine receptor 2-like n=1 Tax=Mizuhopecten yessoensis TaxID=6573 RepID=UPI000B45D841|nr:octopamine receptor 2-like [Mizuhopecten yessoensis]
MLIVMEFLKNTTKSPRDSLILPLDQVSSVYEHYNQYSTLANSTGGDDMFGMEHLRANLCMSNSTRWKLADPVCSLNFTSFWVLVFVAILLGVITLWTIFGNFLVCFALYKFPNLRSMSNCLIGNLAMSDSLLALTVLPISTGNDLLGYWIFGDVMCRVWLCIDVLYCTASIWGLVTIAVDRYTATVYPVWYFERRSPMRALAYIIFVWLFSIVVSLAPFIGWREMIPELYQYNNLLSRYECVLFQTEGYVVYSAMCSFVIPIVLMSFLYVRIFIVLKKRMKHLKPKRNLSLHMESDMESGVMPESNSRMELHSGDFTQMKDQATQISPLLAKSSGNFLLEPKPSFYLNQKTSSSQEMSISTDSAKPQNDDNKTKIYQKPNTDYGINDKGKHNNKTDSKSEFKHLPQTNWAKDTICPPKISIIRTPSCQESFVDDENDESTSNSDNLIHCLPKMEKKNGHCHRDKENKTDENNSNNSHRSSSKKRAKRSSNARIKKHKNSFTRRNGKLNSIKTKYELREQRATKRMAIVMACFTVCWIPFLFMYTIRSFCASCDLNVHIQAAIIWLGYANSALNPILYTLFNDDFRKAFKTILHLGKQKKKSKKLSKVQEQT